VAAASLIRASLLLIGSIFLCVSAWDKLVPRAHYESSSPAAGAVLDRVPESVTVNFSDNLDQSSEISVASTITLESSGETIFEDGKPLRESGPTTGNPKVLKVAMPADINKGLYWVRWKAVAARGKAARFGLLCFAVGMPIPEHITRDTPGALSERNFQERSYRAIFLGGVLLVAFGIMFPHIAHRK
jgi:methionine-rich copper-binding protein CopC